MTFYNFMGRDIAFFKNQVVYVGTKQKKHFGYVSTTHSWTTCDCDTFIVIFGQCITVGEYFLNMNICSSNVENNFDCREILLLSSPAEFKIFCLL